MLALLQELPAATSSCPLLRIISNSLYYPPDYDADRCVRKQAVQIFLYAVVPLIVSFICWIFGSHLLFVFRFEWLTLFPVNGPFPQNSHALAIIPSPL